VGIVGVACVSGVCVFVGWVGLVVRAVTCIYVISVSWFMFRVGVLVVVGCFVRLLSLLRASSSSICRMSMASALSTGSCAGTVAACDFVFCTLASYVREVCLGCISSFPFCVCGTGGVIFGTLSLLVEGGSSSAVIWWSSVACIMGPVRSIRLSVGMGVCG
jgi:hypothetical protein